MAVLALALATPLDAAAKKKVAVLDFKGRQAAKAEKAVVKALKSEGYQIVGPTNWKKAAKRARARGHGKAALAKTAKRAGVSAIVFGKIQKRGRKTFIVLTVHEGSSGAMVERVEVALKRGKIDRKVQAAITQDLTPVVRRAQSAGVANEAPDDKPVRGTRDDERPPVAARDDDKPIRRSDDDRPLAREPARDPVPDGDTPVATKKAGPETPGEKRSLFSASGGMSLWARSMSVSPGGAADTYKGQPVPGLRLDGEVYPAAAFARNWAADFGVGFFLDMIWLKSEMSGGGPKLATTQTRWGVDLRWRLKFTDSATSPVLKAAFQISQLSFKIGDRASAPADLDIPDVTYTNFAPMVGIAVPLGSSRFQLGGSFAFLIAKEKGAPVNTTTKGMPWGIEVGVNFDFYPYPWLLTRAQFGVIRYSVSFAPVNTATATSMSDLYAGGLVSAGYVWH